MYKILDVSITGFWQKYQATSSFRDDVNIVIGKNGTGKTTFMNILHAVLSVDSEALFDNDFQSATIRLVDGKSIKTIKAEKKEAENAPLTFIVYQISRKKISIPLLAGDDRSLPMSYRRRVSEESLKVKQELAEFVSLASLSVYRIGGEGDVDARERPSKRVVSPVDMRLASLMQRLTHYQLELSNEARQVSSGLQRDVLTSLLYKPEVNEKVGYALEFDENQERQNLVSAYKQLGVSGPDIAKRIQEHITSIAKTVAEIKAELSKTKTPKLSIDLAPLEAFKRARKVVDMSLDAESKTEEIFKQVTLFLETLKGFISDKQFTFVGGDLVIARNGGFPISKLSSGEKQLLILLIEALLQRKHPYVFLADEPELSLHIAWQRKIITAIRGLNPNAQIIVATHSPEVAGRFKEAIIDMEDILRV